MIHFNELNAPKPELDSVADQSIVILDKIQSSQQTEDVLTSMKEWDQQRREVGTYLALVYLRFTQNTADLQAKQAKDESDAMRPKLTELENNIKKALVQHPCRQELEQQIGSQMFSLWESEIPTFDPAIAEDLIEESGLESQYTALTASAEFEFNGETHNHSTIGKYREYSDRELRYGAEKVKWQWFEENGDELDDIYDKMVQLRHAMSQKLGFENYVELAYLKMCRVDYDQQDVARYRQMVRDHVTPLGEVIREQQAQALGIEKTMYWDEAVYLSEGNPLPPEDYNTMIRLAQEMFDQQGYGLHDYFRVKT
ncbi:MAG: peptidase M3, partial [Pirellulales bacterium]|nr:peptidase M3 [Pirellulales bacterium]